MLPAALAFGLVIGAAVGALGGGGSVLAVPVLVYALGQGVEEATTASLVVVTVAALAGGSGHARGGRICWRHAVLFTAAAVPGIAVGTAAGGAVGGSVLLVAFAALMLAAAAATWRRAGSAETEREDEAGVALCPPLRVARDIAAGTAIGFLTGFLGIGGGFLVVPTLAVALAFSMRLAIGTSLAIITATSLLGLGAHLAAGRTVDVPVTAAMAAGCLVGALAGAAAAGRTSHRRLGHAFAVLVTGVAAYLLVSVTLLGGPPGS